MSATAMGTTALVAAALVPVVSLVKRASWSKKQNYLVGMIAAMIAAVVGALADGHVTTWQQALTQVLVGLGTAQTVYTLYFKDTNLDKKLTAK